MKDLNYQLGDIVELKKPHPCTSRSTKFKIVRLGADLKIECLGCGNILLISRDSFNKRLKRVIKDN
jgi:hypothetical protein